MKSEGVSALELANGCVRHPTPARGGIAYFCLKIDGIQRLNRSKVAEKTCKSLQNAADFAQKTAKTCYFPNPGKSTRFAT